VDRALREIHDGAPAERLLSYQYLQMLPQLAQGPASKIFVIPSEFTQALGNLTERFADAPPPRGPQSRAEIREASEAAAADAAESAKAAADAAAEANSAYAPG